MQTCLENPVVSKGDGRFDIARANLRGIATVFVLVIECQEWRAGAESLESSLRGDACHGVFAAELSEWQANKLKTDGAEAGEPYKRTANQRA